MPDDKDSKVARAAEIDRAIKEADQKKAGRCRSGGWKFSTGLLPISTASPPSLTSV